MEYKKIPWYIKLKFIIYFPIWKLIRKINNLYMPMNKATGMPEEKGYFKATKFNLFKEINCYVDLGWRNERLKQTIYAQKDHINWLKNKVEELKNEM